MSDRNEKLRSALGFAMKAGKISAGEFAAERAVKSGAARLLAVDAEASENTKKQWSDACMHRKIPMLLIENMGSAIGKEGRMAAAVTDDNFAKMIMSAAKDRAETLTRTEANTDE